ncbi:MAG: HEAT repeat domain-containing protein, partial [Myxococcales bacterium]|nr:HEAT repeat domain-containing protein [Myxococcales bacterium]
MTIVLAAAGLLVIAAAVVTLWVIGRQLVRRTLDRRLLKQAGELGTLLGRLRGDGFEGIDKVLFDMRDTLDHRVIESELRKELDLSGGEVPRDLARSFHLLGLTDRYLDEVRGAMTWRGRARAATALGLLGEPRALRPLVDAMRDPREDDDVKLACAESLGRLRDPAVIAEMCELLGDVDEWASPRLAQVLVAFGPEAVDALLATLDAAPGLNARVWAAQILGRIGDRRATWPLVERLHDRAEQLRMSAANALGELHDARAVPPLIGVILRDPVAAVRAQAARALGQIGDESALPLLVASLGDPEYWMRFRALEAIEALAPSDTQPIETALGDANPEVRRRAVLALERLGKLERPFDDLASDDEMVADQAERRLVAVGRAGLSERLLRALTGTEPRVRARIARVLGQVGEPRHAGDLMALLDDDDPEVALEAVRALGAL